MKLGRAVRGFFWGGRVMIVTGRQIAAARGLLGWTQRDLAAASELYKFDVGVVTFMEPTAGVRLVAKTQSRRDSRARARE